MKKDQSQNVSDVRTPPIDCLDTAVASATLPQTLRYVRCGRGESWLEANLSRNEIHFGWNEIPHDVLERKNRQELETEIAKKVSDKEYKSESARKTVISNSLREVMDALNPERFTWVTVANNKLYWCTAKPEIVFNSASKSEGHFFAYCDRPWSDLSLKGDVLEMKTLPKSVTVMSRYQGTICEPKNAVSIWRAINGEIDPMIAQFEEARANYKQVLRYMIERLHPSDLEDLVDLLFARGGWSRLAKVGGTEKDWDLQTEFPERDESAVVQVKVEAGQGELNNYEQRFIADGRFDTLYFIVARPHSELIVRNETTRVWTSQFLADLVEKRGLSDWLAGRG